MSTISNFFLCLKYPFLKVRNVFTGKSAGYKCTYLDFMDDGWRKAFGQQFLDDLKQALKKDKFLKEFRIIDVKEKYCELVIYCNAYGENTSKVIKKYNLLSMCYCHKCGKPVRYITKGWIEYLCEDCMKEECRGSEDVMRRCRVDSCDIPSTYTYTNGNAEKVDYIKEYDVDFKKLWDVESEE